MNRLVSQMPLALRIKALAEAVLSTRAMKEQTTKEEGALLDELARAEGEAMGSQEGIELSGLIPEGENPYAPAPAEEPVKKSSRK